MPDLLTAYYAAICSVKDGEAAEVELCLFEQYDDHTASLTITIRGALEDGE